MIPLQTGLLSSPCQLHPGSIFYISPREQQFIIGESFLFVLKVWFHDNRASALLFLMRAADFRCWNFRDFIRVSSWWWRYLYVSTINKYNTTTKKSHLKVLPFMYCQTQRHLPQIRHERLNSVGSYYVLRGLLVRACVLRARRIISYRQRGVNPPDFSPPHPRPPPLRQPRCQSPHWGDTYHGSGKSSSAATLTEARRDSRGRLGLETVSSSHQILRSIGSRQ